MGAPDHGAKNYCTLLALTALKAFKPSYHCHSHSSFPFVHGYFIIHFHFHFHYSLFISIVHYSLFIVINVTIVVSLSCRCPHILGTGIRGHPPPPLMLFSKMSTYP